MTSCLANILLSSLKNRSIDGPCVFVFLVLIWGWPSFEHAVKLLPVIICGSLYRFHRKMAQQMVFEQKEERASDWLFEEVFETENYEDQVILLGRNAFNTLWPTFHPSISTLLHLVRLGCWFSGLPDIQQAVSLSLHLHKISEEDLFSHRESFGLGDLVDH